MTRYSAFGHTRYDIADSISVFAQGSYVTSEVEQLQLPFFVPNIAIPRATSRPFESPQLAALLDSRPNQNADWLTSRIAYDNGNRGGFATGGPPMRDFKLRGLSRPGDMECDRCGKRGGQEPITHLSSSLNL